MQWYIALTHLEDITTVTPNIQTKAINYMNDSKKKKKDKYYTFEPQPQTRLTCSTDKWKGIISLLFGLSHVKQVFVLSQAENTPDHFILNHRDEIIMDVLPQTVGTMTTEGGKELELHFLLNTGHCIVVWCVLTHGL